MPRVKKKSIEYGNRKRRKLAAAKRSVVYNQPSMVEGGDQNAVQMTGGISLPTPPLIKSDTDNFNAENDLKYQDIRPRKIENLDSKQNILNTAGIKVEKKKEEYKPIRPIKGLSELISKSIITAEGAAAAVTAVTTMSSLKKVLAGHKTKTPKQPKLPKQTSVKISLPPPKTPVLPTTSTPSTTTANPGKKLMVNFKGIRNSSSSGGNTQKAYALYVGGQLKYILPYNGPLGALSNTQQQNNEMKKLICRGVNGKTEIALAKPTVVCDDEKKKIVFVVQKKATAAAPANSLLSKSNQNSEKKLLKIPTLASLLSTSGQSFKGNQVISDNMLKLLLLPAVSANANSNNPTTPSSTVSSSGQAQKARTSTPQTTQASNPPVTKKPTSSSIPVVVKVQGQSVSTTMTTTTTPITTATTTTTTITTSSTPIITTTTDTTNVKSQSSPVSSSSTSPTSVRPVQLFTRDSARKLCPAPSILTPGNKPCMAILDPSDPEANIRPGKSLLGNSEPTQIVSKQPAYQGTTGANQILIKKTSADTSVILHFKDTAGVSSIISPSEKDNKLSDIQSPTKDTQLDLTPQTTIPVSLPSSDKTETMTDITAPACVEEENANNDDDDGGMFGLKISSVFSLAENQLCSPAGEAAVDQDRKLMNDTSPESFEQDPIPADTLATAMKLAVTPEVVKANNEIENGGTVIVNLEPDNKSSQSQNLQIVLDTSQSKHTNLEKSSIAKSMINVEQQTLTSFDPDLESVLSGKLSVDSQTNHSQKENDSPKKGTLFVGSEKDFLAGQKYITVDIFRHNGQTKITAVSSSGKKEVTNTVCQPNGNGEGASGSSFNDNKSTSSVPDTRLNEVLQCAAYSLPMGTYFFIPLPDKTVAIPSQRHKKNRSAYVFEKNHNFMQVKMAKYMIFNSKDKLPSQIALTNMNSSQLVCQVSNPSKTNEEPSIILPVPSVLPVKDPVPILEAPPIVTGKRIRRPKKHTGFEEDMNMIPPLRKYRKNFKSVKAEKNVKVQTKTEKNSHNVTTKLKGKDTGLVSSSSSSSNNNKLLQPVDSKDELAAVLRSVNMPVAISKNSNATSLPYVFVSPPGTKISAVSKSTTTESSTSEAISQDSNQSGLHIDNVQSLQPVGVKIKSEPITSGYGDEPVKDLSPLLAPASSVQIGHDALGVPHTIKKEPSWYGYETPLSSSKLLCSMNTTTSTSQSDYMNTSSINMNTVTPSKESYNPDTPHPSLNRKDSSTNSPTGKKRGRKKKETVEIKPEVKKRKFYVRHKLETIANTPSSVAASSLMSTFSVCPLKSEVKIESAELSQSSPSSQSGETPQEERIRRLKEILREKEQKLEEIRHNLSVSTQNVG